MFYAHAQKTRDKHTRARDLMAKCVTYVRVRVLWSMGEQVLVIHCIIDEVRRDMTSYDVSPDPQVLDHLILQLDILRFHFVLFGMDNCILRALTTVVEILTDMNRASDFVLTNFRGRPRLEVSEEQLVNLLSLRFAYPTIASMLGVSLRTLRRRMTELGLSVYDFYSTISDQDLDLAVSALKLQYPNSGYRMMAGLLLQQGVRVKQMQLRDSMHRVDPNGIAIRWRECIRRRQYSVPYPLALWHLDGNHKLIR